MFPNRKEPDWVKKHEEIHRLIYPLVSDWWMFFIAHDDDRVCLK